MELVSFHHNLEDRILVKLATGRQAAAHLADVERWLQVIEGVSSITGDSQTGELLILFDKDKIDANTLLHLLGYSGPFVRPKLTANGTKTRPQQ